MIEKNTEEVDKKFDELLQILEDTCNILSNKKKEEDTENCVICLEKVDKNIVTLECKHKFHFHCLMELSLHSSSKCPLCRNNYESADVSKIVTNKDKEIKDLKEYVRLLQNENDALTDNNNELKNIITEYSSFFKRTNELLTDVRTHLTNDN